MTLPNSCPAAPPPGSNAPAAPGGSRDPGTTVCPDSPKQPPSRTSPPVLPLPDPSRQLPLPAAADAASVVDPLASPWSSSAQGDDPSADQRTKPTPTVPYSGDGPCTPQVGPNDHKPQPHESSSTVVLPLPDPRRGPGSDPPVPAPDSQGKNVPICSGMRKTQT